MSSYLAAPSRLGQRAPTVQRRSPATNRTLQRPRHSSAGWQPRPVHPSRPLALASTSRSHGRAQTSRIVSALSDMAAGVVRCLLLVDERHRGVRPPRRATTTTPASSGSRASAAARPWSARSRPLQATSLVAVKLHWRSSTAPVSTVRPTDHVDGDGLQHERCVPSSSPAARCSTTTRFVTA